MLLLRETALELMIDKETLIDPSHWISNLRPYVGKE